MRLLLAQQKFSIMFAHLLLYAEYLGYKVTLGDLYRDPRAPYGHKDSLHKKRLAGDINLFKDDVYLTKTEDYLTLGEYWEGKGGAWGGRFKRPDGNHFSIEYRGMK